MVYKLNKKKKKRKQNTNTKKEKKFRISFFFLFFVLSVSIIQEQESIKDRKKDECSIHPPTHGRASIRIKKKTKKRHGVVATK
jgi:hypothetical protein